MPSLSTRATRHSVECIQGVSIVWVTSRSHKLINTKLKPFFMLSLITGWSLMCKQVALKPKPITDKTLTIHCPVLWIHSHLISSLVYRVWAWRSKAWSAGPLFTQTNNPISHSKLLHFSRLLQRTAVSRGGSALCINSFESTFDKCMQT